MNREQIKNLATDELLDLKELHETTIRKTWDSEESHDIAIELALIERELKSRRLN